MVNFMSSPNNTTSSNITKAYVWIKNITSSFFSSLYNKCIKKKDEDNTNEREYKIDENQMKEDNNKEENDNPLNVFQNDNLEKKLSEDENNEEQMKENENDGNLSDRSINGDIHDNRPIDITKTNNQEDTNEYNVDNENQLHIDDTQNQNNEINPNMDL
ncbi:MAG: hypothetical protein ACI8ZF_000932 [Candidatus Midichloriaceae bacterium]|jgi:hypothetical protein